MAGQPLPVANRMCRATYLMLFRRAGLEIEDVRNMPQAFHDKLQTYDRAELRAAEMSVKASPTRGRGTCSSRELRSLLIPE